MFKAYKITTKQLNTGVSTNISLFYHPSTCVPAVKHCQHLLIAAHHSIRPQLACVLPEHTYTTLKRNTTLGDLLFNYRSVDKNYRLDSPPACCGLETCTSDKHGLLMPQQLPQAHTQVLRNLGQPAVLRNNVNVRQVYDALVTLSSNLHVYTQSDTHQPPPISLISENDTYLTIFNFPKTFKIYNTRLNFLMFWYLKYQDVRTPHVCLTTLHRVLEPCTHLSSLPRPSTVFFDFVLTACGPFHELFSHPSRAYTSLRTTYTTWLPSQTRTQSAFRLFGSRGTPWEYRWVSPVMILCPPIILEMANHVCTWLNRSFNENTGKSLCLLLVPTSIAHIYTSALSFRYLCAVLHYDSDTSVFARPGSRVTLLLVINSETFSVLDNFLSYNAPCKL